MTTNLDAAQDKQARVVADEVKGGQAEAVGSSLAAAYLSMGKDSAKFGEFLKKVEADNAEDRKTNDHLPGLDFGPDSSGNLRVNLTTAGQIFGNKWQNNEEVFADIKTHNESVGNVGGEDKSGHETVIADSNSVVHASGNVHVIAEAGSNVDAVGNTRVTAQRGSSVCIYNGGDAELRGQVTAESGSTVRAGFNSIVSAEAGSHVSAMDNSLVTAEAGSNVDAWQHSQITAKAGSIVMANDFSQVTADAGSEVATRDNALRFAPPAGS